MAKRKTQGTPDKQFRLSGKAAARLNNYLSEIKKGITSVCELHTHDSNPSLGKADFEVAYIDKLLGQTATAVSVSIRAMAEGLQAQKEKEAKALMEAAAAAAESEETPTEGKEDTE